MVGSEPCSVGYSWASLWNKQQEVLTLNTRRRPHRSQASAPEEMRYLRNFELAEYLGITTMCLWRWQHDAVLGFPQPTRINNISYTDKQAVDGWMRGRVADLAIRPAKEK